jgi:3-oxoadipate enol-lactonase
MPFVQVRDIEVYYEIHGSGPRVVVINGTGADLRQNPLRGKGLLEQHFEVLMYDQRGLGQTSKPDVDYTMADYADDAAALMDAVGWPHAHVIGISFGGMVAQHLAIRHRAKVERLVLACTSSGGAGGASFDLLAVHDLPADERLRATLPILDSRNDLSVEPPVLAPFFDVMMPMMASGRVLNADDPCAAMGARRQLQARADHDAWDRLGEIDTPTLVTGGRFDRQAPVDNVERLANAIAGAVVQFFEGGHLFLIQDSTAWPAVVDFFQTNSQVG